MITKATFAALLLAILAMTAPVTAGAADPKPALPAEAGTDVGNWGTMPYSPAEQALTNPENKKAMRELEDRQIKEVRVLEDKQDEERMALKRKQANEREALKRSFK
ncbi:hypothetical protein CCC_01829 [Paramagnetospirillum magnetotacticum MS-1]|uniref:Uncharacterized protein n=1 Tax=Paramagnetospirillum magnetotacticum MS-1 TaxID=272627 RepID=A0A0C2UFX1_PARME|nr:hypothetical protein [Paramagnetospirillum magnetotacticum]KIM00418.1 hypothetical protein CCC_01829 [Paramagnetospirillum magnetotacticum MS-1]